MKKLISGATDLSSIALMIGLLAFGCSSPTRTTQGSLANISVSQIALMPFLVGQMESPNTPIAKPLSQPLTEMISNSHDLPDGTDRVMDRIVNAELKLRFETRLIPPDRVTEAYRSIEVDPTLDTPRKRAVGLGKALGTDLVMVGTIWWFRDKGTLADVPDSPASVGFALYLVDVTSGARLWRGAFEGTQEALTQDVLGGLGQLDMGLRWLSAEALANYGVKSVLRKLPLK